MNEKTNLEKIRNCLITTDKKQTTGNLYKVNENRYCAMGVIYKELGNIDIEEYEHLMNVYTDQANEQFSIIQDQINSFERQYDLNDGLKVKIMQLNDYEHKSFVEIALELGDYTN